LFWVLDASFYRSKRGFKQDKHLNRSVSLLATGINNDARKQTSFGPTSDSSTLYPESNRTATEKGPLFEIFQNLR
jgi:hypothetical protein